jgi:hypothetical protein
MEKYVNNLAFLPNFISKWRGIITEVLNLYFVTYVIWK